MEPLLTKGPRHKRERIHSSKTEHLEQATDTQNDNSTDATDGTRFCQRKHKCFHNNLRIVHRTARAMNVEDYSIILAILGVVACIIQRICNEEQLHKIRKDKILKKKYAKLKNMKKENISGPIDV